MRTRGSGQAQRQLLIRGIERRDERPDDGREHRDRDNDSPCSRHVRVLFVSNTRVEHAVDQIRQQIHADRRHSDEEDAPLHEWIVTESDRLNQQSSDARPREDRLGDDGAGENAPN